MTTPTNDRQTSERERLVLPMTASMVPHPMYASGWNACLGACKEVLDYQHAEIERLRAEVATLRDKLAPFFRHDGIDSLRQRAEKAELELAALRERIASLQSAIDEAPAREEH